MIKTCSICQNKISINNFSKRWDKNQNKYYLSYACKKCIQNKARHYRKSDKHKKTYKKWAAKGFFGWDLKFENEILRKQSQLVELEFRSLWSKKVDDISANSFKYKNIKKREKDLDKDIRIRNATIRSLQRTHNNKKNFRASLINSETIFLSILGYQSAIFSSSFVNNWEKKLTNLNKSARRDVRL